MGSADAADRGHPTLDLTDPTGLPAPAPEVEAAEHGRIGYGRLARFTPFGLAALLILGLAAIGLARQAPFPMPGTASPGLVGRPAPDLTLTLLDGTPLRLADLRGSVVVLNFWASWCAPCRDEMPVLQRLTDRQPAPGGPVAVVGVGVRTDHDAAARALVRDLGLTYPIGRDTDVSGPGVGPFQRAFAVADFLPATVVLRPDGVIDRLHLGPVTDEQLRTIVAAASDPAG